MHDFDDVVKQVIKDNFNAQEQVKLYNFLADLISTIDAAECGILQGFTYNLAYLTTQIEQINKEV